MIVHQFQSWWKMMKKWWILIDFCTHNQIWGSDEFSSESVEFWSKFSRVFSPTHCTGCVQRVGVWPGHQVDFRNRFLDTQRCYGIVLWVPKHLGSDSEIPNVNMTVSDFYEIQIFKIFKSDVFLNIYIISEYIVGLISEINSGWSNSAENSQYHVSVSSVSKIRLF